MFNFNYTIEDIIKKDSSNNCKITCLQSKLSSKFCILSENVRSQTNRKHVDDGPIYFIK